MLSCRFTSLNAFMKRILAIRKMERDGLIIEHPKKRKDLYQTYVQQGMQQSRGLLQYNQMLHIDLNKLVHQQKKLSKKVKILDVGAGEGATLLELKDSQEFFFELDHFPPLAPPRKSLDRCTRVV